MAPFGVLGMLVALLGGGGANSLLDFLPADAYWKAKGVAVTVEAMVKELGLEPEAPKPKAPDVAALVRDLGAADYATREAARKRLVALGPAAADALKKAIEADDPEVRVSAREILDAIQARKLGPGGPMAKPVRRLMAIRTLGELKKPEALSPLRKLLDAKEPFVADFARRAIAAIEGKPRKAPAPDKKALHEDLCLLPANCGLVAQTSLQASGKPLGDIFAQIPAGMVPGNFRKELTEGLIKVAEMVGNIRVDQITMGLADNIGRRDGFVVLVARGLYDPAALKAALLQAHHVAVNKIDGVEVIQVVDGRIIPLSSTRLIAAFGEDAEDIPLDQIIAAVKAKAPKLALGPRMQKLLKPIDVTCPLWLAVAMSDAYRQAPILAALDDLVLTTRRDKDALDLTLVAHGKDADALRDAAAQFDAGLKEATQEIGKAVQMFPAAKTIVDFLGSVKAVTDGAKATVTATLKSPSSLLMTPMIFFMGMRAGATHQAVEVGPPPVPPRPVRPAPAPRKR